MPATIASDRLAQLPPYLFQEIDRKKRAALAAGKDLINLGVGDPDRPTHAFIIEAMAQAMQNPANHRYPFDEGVPAFKTTVAAFLRKRYGLSLDPADSILTTIGSKEGIAHLPLAVTNPGDVVIVPQPGYPVYYSSAVFAGCQPYIVPLLEENAFLPDLDSIPVEVLQRTRLFWVNYPNNPTAALAPRSFYEKLAALAEEHDFLIASDNAYAEVSYEQRALSILEIPQAAARAIEFHSLSKTFNMTGWRLGFAAGGKDIIAALAKVKSNADSGQFNAIQWAGKTAYEQIDGPEVTEQLRVYRERRDALTNALRQAGWHVCTCQGAFYVWAATPMVQHTRLPSMDVASRILDEAAVVTIPGLGFGKAGEGYIRLALTVETPRLLEAAERISRLSW